MNLGQKIEYLEKLLPLFFQYLPKYTTSKFKCVSEEYINMWPILIKFISKPSPPPFLVDFWNRRAIICPISVHIVGYLDKYNFLPVQILEIYL